MADLDPIVVIHTFNNPIDAHIIKTKLDAYGVPCYLSQEHLTTLTTPLLSGGIRLHIFEKDRDEAVRVLLISSGWVNEEDDLISCPVCRSKKVLGFRKDGFEPNSMVKLILQVSKNHYCLDCETEFDV